MLRLVQLHFKRYADFYYQLTLSLSYCWIGQIYFFNIEQLQLIFNSNYCVYLQKNLKIKLFTDKFHIFHANNWLKC